MKNVKYHHKQRLCRMHSECRGPGDSPPAPCRSRTHSVNLYHQSVVSG